MADTITVPQHYLDTLIRRAALHSDLDPRRDDSILIPKAEYTDLLQAKREYLFLRETLIRGGLTLETLNTLLSGASEESEGYEHIDSWEAPSTVGQATAGVRLYGQTDSAYTKHGAVTVTEVESEAPYRRTDGNLLASQPTFVRKASGAVSSLLDADEDFLPETSDAYASRAPFPRNDQRTILISNLNDRTTHLDIAQIIRGGRVLDLYLRADRTAAVSFVEGAADFLAYTKRKDVYMHGKRLEFRWSERQFHMPHHVANKIANGATRNIVIRASTARSGPSSQEPLTEQGLRDDLEHIHNLQVVSVTFKNGDCYISTNSVHNALFARTCMMSRAKYKGMRIEWYPDECAQCIPQVERTQPSPPWKTHAKAAVVKQAPTTSLSNRFGVLDMDGTDDSSSESGMQAGIGANWADEGIAV